MPNELTKKKCSPCEKDATPLQGEALTSLQEQLSDEWKVIGGRHLEREYSFKDFKDALDFTNRVGAVAEEQGHHPDISLGWGKVKLDLWTHNVGGLTENDFILAAKADSVR